MIIAMSGATGFIGRSLIRKFNLLEWNTRVINRDSMSMPDEKFREEKIEEADVVINLAGAPVSARWTPEYKKEIMESRVLTTRKIRQAISESRRKPSLFISASAVGIYDSLRTHTEESSAYSNSYLAEVCKKWEDEATPLANQVRTVILRLGVVLGRNGGALEKMERPFSIGLGARIGNGEQAVSFIHIDDLTGIILFLIENPSLSGIVNAVSPFPTTNRDLTDILAKALKQPAWLAVPAFALKMAYGEGSSVLLEGQRVMPARLQEAGFRFRYPTLQNALVQIYR